MRASALLYATAENPVNYAPLIYALVILLVAVGALAGYARGIMRQFVRSITVVISFFAAYAATMYGYHYVDMFLSDKTMGDVHAWLITFRVVDANADVSWLYSIDVNAARELLAIPFCLVLIPLLFVVAFVIISILMLIIHKIVSALSGFKKRKNNFGTRLLGMILGAVQGAFVSAVILTPVLGISGMAKEAVGIMNDYAPGDRFTEVCEEKYDAYAKGISENPVILLYSKCGGSLLYEKIVTVNQNGAETNMTDLLPDGVKIVSDGAKLWGADAKNLTRENEAAIDKILATVNSNSYFKGIVAGAVSSSSYLYVNGNLTFTVEEPFKSILDSAAAIFHTTTEDNISEDLETLSDVYFILSRDGVLTAFDKGSDEMLRVLTAKDGEGNTTVSRVVSVIRSNERTKPLVTLITKLSVTVMANQSGVSEDALSTYDNIKDGINSDILTIDKESFSTEEEYVAEVSDALDATLKENNIELEREIVDTMAQYVADNFSDTEVLTDDMASDIIISYYDAYLKYLETEKLPQG